jgi:hypothetical protein
MGGAEERGDLGRGEAGEAGRREGERERCRCWEGRMGARTGSVAGARETDAVGEGEAEREGEDGRQT